ncbi:carboxylesterase family protein [Crateriforma conspicua]|uniref:carboxylesterase family protein n=1 Tax=Crateriforma conspicua TaxID=2527996 RepID=UPI0011896C73|nr:alpha/beta hydrolase [Crateriforma conspicua]QDV65807.1 Alpha/beta hydrolase family protein [Crateriforma conspicua]
MNRIWFFVWSVILCGATLLRPTFVAAEQLVLLRNGMELRGNYIEIPTIDKNAFSGGGTTGGGALTIAMIDDGLKRTYVHRRGMVVRVNQIDPRGQAIEIWQPKHGSGTPVGGLGRIYGVSPLNAHGRREIFIRGPKGDTEAVLQGITELTPRYASLEALTGRPSYKWDMRVATSTISSDSLRSLFGSIFDQQSREERLKAVRFFISTERYADAKEELQRIKKDFPDANDGLDLDASITEMSEQIAMQYLQEAQTRLDAGQPQLASDILNRIPVGELSRERRLQVSDAKAAMTSQQQRVDEVRERLTEQVAQLPQHSADALQTWLDELARDFNPATLDRLSDYLRLGELDNLPLESRVALAVSGWIMGGGSGEQNLKVATSLIEVRDLVVEYLGETTARRRTEILDRINRLEGGQPEYIARMLPLIPPALTYPDRAFVEDRVGLIAWPPQAQTDAPEIDSDPVTTDFQYEVQLPPEYDPRRSYPCIVALHPAGGSPRQQIIWWAGQYNEGLQQRVGLGSRHGFVVVAPRWNRPGQRSYEYTATEHHRVLSALRHAMRRVSIDSDRVFIAGHGHGGTAAWDIAVSHPDHWAGLIAISGEPDKTILHYDKNSRYIPKYFVIGEIDGSPPPLARNGAIYDDYLKPNDDSVVVEYRGRGNEHFFEESPDLFQWMQLSSHRRPAIPRDLELATMRPTDNYFWWLELNQMNDAVLVDPVLWENVRRAGSIDSKVNEGNQIRVKGPAKEFRIGLTPDMGIDLAEPIIVRYGTNSRASFDYDGGVQSMLDDVRSRADRRRPFWMFIQIP